MQNHPAPVPCPICDAETAMYDVVDFNKNCQEARQHFLPLSGRPVYYHRCPECGFMLAPALTQWSAQQFEELVYNSDYPAVDPDAASTRPQGNAAFLQQLFGASRHEIRHFDYGGGNEVLVQTLRAQGWESVSGAPFAHHAQPPGPQRTYNLISAFEVFARVPDVHALMRTLSALMADECMVIFSTLLSDSQIKPNARLSWWYAAPRNAHINLFSKQSLLKLAHQYGMQFGSLTPGMHCLSNQLPPWGKRLLAA